MLAPTLRRISHRTESSVPVRPTVRAEPFPCAALRVKVTRGVGALAYIGLSMLLRVEALDFFTAALLRRIRG